MHKSTMRVKPKTKFGRWLLDNMQVLDYTCGDVAKKLGTTRQCVWNHITGASKPNFVWVIAYCWLFEKNDDPNNVYYLTMEKEP